MDWTVLITAVLTALPGVLVGLYALWRTKVAADGVQDWKDSVTAAIDSVAGKVTDLNKPTV